MKKRFLFLFFVSSFTTILFSQQPNPIISGKARFSIITPELIRMEYSLTGKFVDDSTLFAVGRNNFSENFNTVQLGDTLFITTSRFKLRYINDGFPFSQMNIRITVFNKPKNYEWRIYSSDNQNLGGPVSTLDGVSGEIPTNPGLLSRNGWQIIDDSGKDLLTDGWLAQRDPGHLKDLYFFAYGKDYKAALKSLTVIGGKVPMTRKYVHGSWYCRWWNYTTEEYQKIVNEYKEHNFPLDILVMDMGWHTQKEATYGMGHAGMYGWTGYTWNRKLIPEPEKLIAELKADNIYVPLNDHPHDGIRKHEDNWPHFVHGMGIDTNGNGNILFNAGDKKYMTNFFKYAHEPNEKMGVEFWWLDWQQDYLLPHVTGFPKTTHLSWLNHLYFQHSQQNGKRGLGFSRWSGWGSHRYPIQFSGDTEATWDMLRFQVPFTANSSNAGCFFWAHDVGGFSGAKNAELYVRWSQFALTNSSLRIHSVYDKNLDRRPWLWGNQAEDALKKVYKLRSELMPYIYSSVADCYFQSLPLIKGMYIEYPEEKRAYENPQQYLFGNLMLAAPVVSPGEGENFISSQKVWFPKGSWYNVFNHTKYVGDTTITVRAKISETPLFVKGGYPLPMQNFSQRMASTIPDTLVIRCYPGNEGEKNQFQLYEDDGISNKYLNGVYANTLLEYEQQNNAAIITINPVQGKMFVGQPESKAYTIQLPTVNIKQAFVNNKKAVVKYDIEGGFGYISISKTKISKKLNLKVLFE